MHLEKDQHRGSFTFVSAFHLRNGPDLGTTATPPLKTGVKLYIAISATGRFAASGRARLRSDRGKAEISRMRAASWPSLADNEDDGVSGGNTQAWVQVYLPGPG